MIPGNIACVDLPSAGPSARGDEGSGTGVICQSDTCEEIVSMADSKMMSQMSEKPGFIAALDQSGGIAANSNDTGALLQKSYADLDNYYEITFDAVPLATHDGGKK